MAATSVAALRDIATQLRIDSVASTSKAGSGHPTTCLSAADIMSVLFFSEMHFDPKNPQDPDNDRFVLSKGHAAPILYAAWAEAGLFPRERLMELRTFESDLEGHPTPRLPFVDVATGSLGQGICAAVGIALNARRIGSGYRTYVLLGDGEIAEGSVWEAADAAAHYKLDNLCAIVDANALGQSQPTEFRHDLDRIAARWSSFGWKAVVVDGHDIADIRQGLAIARATSGQPTALVARTIKGKGLSAIEGKDGWHGKALKSGEETDKALKELESQLTQTRVEEAIPGPRSRGRADSVPDYSALPPPNYKLGDLVATREAWGTALAAVGKFDPRIVALDADVKNSTFSDRFEKVAPERFFEMFIAEQGMVGAAMGFAARGAIPFPSTFACFLYRAADFIRMAGISMLNLKLTGSHAGVSIGEDGPSQMALEDLAMMRAIPDAVVLYPCDAVSTERLVAEMAQHKGLAYMRTSRPKTPVIYGPDERFPIGGSKVVRQSADDAAVVVGVGHHAVRSAEGARSAQGRRDFDPRDRRLLRPADRQEPVDQRRPGRRRRRDHGRGSLLGRRARRRGRRGAGGLECRRPAAGGARHPAQRPARRARGQVRHLGPADRRGREAQPHDREGLSACAAGGCAHSRLSSRS